MDELLRKLKKSVDGNLEGELTIYFHIPQKVSYPYVSIEVGEIVHQDEQKIQGLLKVTVWSRYPGVQEIIQDSERVRILFEGSHANESLFLRLEEKTIKLLNDGVTRQGILVFRFTGRR